MMDVNSHNGKEMAGVMMATTILVAPLMEAIAVETMSRQPIAVFVSVLKVVKLQFGKVMVGVMMETTTRDVTMMVEIVVAIMSKQLTAMYVSAKSQASKN